MFNAKLRALVFTSYKSEAELARDLGWSRQKLNRITSGMREPSLDDTVKIAEKLNTSVQDMVHIFLREWSPNGQHGQAQPSGAQHSA